jgi:serine/threonine-protein kinase
MVPAIAHAQSASDQAAATALFKQGRDLMAAGKYADACPKLAESQRLDPGAGTLLNLATCYEKNGQIASAWTTYQDAASAAQKAGEAERVKAARAKVAALEPTLPTLTIVVPAAADRPDLEIRRDGALVGRAAWGAPIPVDPGPHPLDASAPGKTAWHGQAQVGGAGAKVSIEIPPLNDAAAPVPTAPAAPATTAPATTAPAAPPADSTAPSSSGSTQRLLGLISGGVGLVGIGVGSVFGAIAMSENNSTSGHCNGTVCDAPTVSTLNDARDDATVSTVAFIAGGVLLAAGVVLYLTAPKGAPTTGLLLSPGAGGSIAGLTLQGGWQ